jgi:penicillin amidase
MRKLSFTFSLLLTVGTIWLLDHSFSTPIAPIPAFGKFLNPFTGFWQNAEPAKDLLVQLPIESDSLLKDVEVVFDDRMVPHIFAENAVDAYFAQGYMMAKDRLFQMDLMARSASGRLSEIFGSSTLEKDQYKRRLGMQYAAEKALEVWKKDSTSFEILKSYINGANAYIENLSHENYPLEYKLFDFKPEKWTPLKSALVFKAMGEMLAFRAKDIEATNAKAFFNESTFKFLYPEYFPEQAPVIPREVAYNFDAPDSTEVIETANLEEVKGYLGNVYLEVGEENIGSNNWVIARGKTKNGNAILCGDPHLYLTLPSIWYEVQMNTPEMNVYGVSLPGIPGVIIGFNNHVSWSMTNTEHDVADFYTIQWKDSTKQEYLIDSQFVMVDKRVEELTVKSGWFEREIIDTVRYTSWGPVIHESEENERDLALRWLCHDAPLGSEIAVFNQMNKAKNYDDFEEAIAEFSSPSQNIAYADVEGNIGLFIQGVFPKKRQGQGRFIQDGTNSRNAWDGMIPKSYNPKVKNPVWGYVASANQNSTTGNFPYYYNSEFFEAYRGRFIQRNLTKNVNFSVEDMKALQNNNYSLKVEDLFNMMMAPLDFDRMNDAEKAIFKFVRKWDYNYDRHALEPVYFEEWFRIFYEKVWDEISTQEQYQEIMYPTQWRTVYILRDLPESNFFDIKSTPERESAEDIITTAFQEMVQSVAERLLVEPDLNWSNFRNTTISNLVGVDAFSAKKVYTDGYAKSINAVTSTTGPSWRMVVEMNETPKAWVAYPGGQSGNPGSQYYDNFIGTWAEGEYYEAVFLKSQEEDNERLLFTQNFRSLRDEE